ASGVPGVANFLENWAGRNVWQSDETGTFFIGTADGNTLTLQDIDTSDASTGTKDDFNQIRPNGGVRRLVGTALVQFQLTDADPAKRSAALESIARQPQADQLAPLQASVEGEADATLLARKVQLVNFLTARFADDASDRIAAIESLSKDTTVEARSVLNQILTSRAGVAATVPDANIKQIFDPATDPHAFYSQLVEAGLAPPMTDASTIRSALEDNIVNRRVGNVPLAQLNTDDARLQAYAALAGEGLTAPLVLDTNRDATLSKFVFFDQYDEPDASITAAAEATLTSVETRVGWAQTVDLTLDGLSLASIYFLAAIGLAITFGVMGVINMAHGEFIMMGAYTGYVVQLFIPDYTLSILVALPLAFAITFGAGVTMERLVIRHLYHRPLETLLATFGISIALQQLAKNIFGTQARPLTSPEWLDGALVF
ncbi:MAG: urea ABC transporter permease subunit UrtB, partial [Pseudomonadota bacterium]